MTSYCDRQNIKTFDLNRLFEINHCPQNRVWNWINGFRKLSLPVLWSLVLMIYTVTDNDIFGTENSEFWKQVFGFDLTLSQTSPGFTCLQNRSFQNTVGKEEIARNEQFIFFPQCFLLVWRTFCHFHQIWNCRLQTLWVWKSLKFVILERVIPYPAEFELLTVKWTKF